MRAYLMRAENKDKGSKTYKKVFSLDSLILYLNNQILGMILKRFIHFDKTFFCFCSNFL